VPDPESAMTDSALQLTDVRKTYRSGDDEVVALDHATLEVGRDELVALVGPSGSGKTTLLSVAGALLGPSDGQVRVGDTDVSDLSEKERTAFRGTEIGFVFQAVNLVPFLTARENLTVMSSIADASKKEIEARADQLLEELGLAKRRNNLPEQLSGGERQRVAIGRALVTDPELILVDEPTASLDTELGRAVVQLLSSEVKKRGKAGIMVTHDLRMVEYTDRTLHIVDGRLGLHDESAEDEMVS
jgi:putative ABC transport system ATP-binding protein